MAAAVAGGVAAAAFRGVLRASIGHSCMKASASVLFIFMRRGRLGWAPRAMHVDVVGSTICELRSELQEERICEVL